MDKINSKSFAFGLRKSSDEVNEVQKLCHDAKVNNLYYFTRYTV